MKKPKYNIGDKVWSTHESKVISNTVTGVFIASNGVEYITFHKADGEQAYLKWCPDFFFWEEAEKHFPSKDELIKSL